MNHRDTHLSVDGLPHTGYIRQSHLLARPGFPAPLPFSPSTLWRMVRAEKFPTPIKLSANVTAWRVEDVREWLEAQAGVAKSPCSGNE